MSAIVKKLLIFPLVSLLFGCSSMHVSEQQVGTVAGAVAGGLVGTQIGSGSGQIVAIAVGSLIGGASVYSLFELEKYRDEQINNEYPYHRINRREDGSEEYHPSTRYPSGSS